MKQLGKRQLYCQLEYQNTSCIVIWYFTVQTEQKLAKQVIRYMQVCMEDLLALRIDSGYELLQLCQCQRLSSWIQDSLIQQVVSKDLLNTHTQQRMSETKIAMQRQTARVDNGR